MHCCRLQRLARFFPPLNNPFQSRGYLSAVSWKSRKREKNTKATNPSRTHKQLLRLRLGRKKKFFFTKYMITRTTHASGAIHPPKTRSLLCPFPTLGICCLCFWISTELDHTFPSRTHHQYNEEKGDIKIFFCFSVIFFFLLITFYFMPIHPVERSKVKYTPPALSEVYLHRLVPSF